MKKINEIINNWHNKCKCYGCRLARQHFRKMVKMQKTKKELNKFLDKLKSDSEMVNYIENRIAEKIKTY